MFDRIRGRKASLWGKGPVRKRSMKAKRMEWGGGGSWRGEGGFVNERSKAGRRQRRFCQHKSVLGRVSYWWSHLVQLLTQEPSLHIYVCICHDIITGVSWRLTWGSFACAVDLPPPRPTWLCLHVCRDLQRLQWYFLTVVFHLGFVYLVTWHLSAPDFLGENSPTIFQATLVGLVDYFADLPQVGHFSDLGSVTSVGRSTMSSGLWDLWRHQGYRWSLCEQTNHWSVRQYVSLPISLSS